MFFKLKEGSRTRGHKAALVKEQCSLDTKKYSISQRVINVWNKLPNDCVNASSVNMFTNRIDRYLIRAGYTDENIFGLSISQWLPCPLVIWNLLFEIAILLNLVKSIDLLCLLGRGLWFSSNILLVSMSVNPLIILKTSSISAFSLLSCRSRRVNRFYRINLLYNMCFGNIHNFTT